MNKYQEAYKRLTNRTYKYADKESVYKDLDVLKPLVEKTRPKIMVNVGAVYGVTYYICPVCNGLVRGIDKYCSSCGQRIDTIVGDE